MDGFIQIPYAKVRGTLANTSHQRANPVFLSYHISWPIATGAKSRLQSGSNPVSGRMASGCFYVILELPRNYRREESERGQGKVEKHRGHMAYCMVVLALLVLLTGCAGQDSQAAVDLIPLQVQLVSEYGGSAIAVALQDGNMLSVTVAGDSSSSLGGAQRVEQAREIAEFVCEHYRSIGRIDRVRVVFENRQGGSVVDSSGSLAYSFARQELACWDR